MTLVLAGSLTKQAVGRMGRATKFPPQLGQIFPKTFSAQSWQKVHS